MSTPEDQIVFEDLHGAPETDPVTVDLDADTKDDGITRTPDDQSADDDDKKDDDIQFDGLRPDDDDSGEQDDKEDDASKVSEDDDYSKKVKARIGREQRAKRKERKRGDYWEQQARTLAKDAYERDKTALKGSIEQADSAITQVQSDLERAIEDGQTKDQVRLTNRLTDLKADKAKAEFGLDNLSEDGNVTPFDDKISAEPDKGQKKEADEWMDSRSDWYGAKGFERQTRLANMLDKEVYKDGYDPNTPEYFDELDRRIKEKEPKLYEDLDASADDDTDKDDKDDTTERKPGKTIVAPVGGEHRQRSKSSSKVELGEEDFATMREFNLDPNDPEVLKEFARNKREAESRGRR